MLVKSEVGCFIGNWFVGVLAYADDIVLLAPSASAMCAMLHRCHTFAEQFNVIFNKMVKTGQFTTKCKGSKVIALKLQKLLWWDSA